jgi:broad specificity phosphatase PhoE
MPPLYVFIRHGEALHNIANRIHGTIAYTFKENEDAPLSEEGHVQTRKAGRKLATIFGDRKVDIFSSPLTRCIQTAVNASAHLNICEKNLDEHIIERLGGGHLCNNRKSLDELSTLYPDWNMGSMKDPPYIPLEREETTEVGERMKHFWNWIQEAYRTSDRGVLIVSHCESLRALLNKTFMNAEFMVVPQ